VADTSVHPATSSHSGEPGAESCDRESGELLQLAERLAGQARNGEQIEAYVSRSVEVDTRAYDGEVESFSSASTAGVGVRVVARGRQGFAYAGSLEEDVVAETLEEARDNVEFATVDENVGLPEPDGRPPAALELWDDSVLGTPTAAKVAMALELERRVRGADPRVRQVAYCDYGDVAFESAIASSTGISASTQRTVCSVSVTAIVGKGAQSQTGTGFSVARSPKALDLSSAAIDAVERATRMLGAAKPKSGRFVVVFDPRVSSSLLGIISSALSGEAVTKGRSFFAGRVGDQVATEGVALVDDPTDRRAYGAATHDAEGLACRRNLLIEDGVLRGFVFDTISARRASVASTASAVRGGYASVPTAGCRAVLLAPGELGSSEILNEVGEGVYVQSVTGLHSGVNPISGDFSVGAEGLMIRGGDFAEPVREMTIASTLQRMLLSVLHVGTDVEWLPGVAAGQTLAIEDMSLSGA
jgi:PmbA protein